MDLKRLYALSNHPSYYKQDEVCPGLAVPLPRSAAAVEQVVGYAPGGYQIMRVVPPAHAKSVPRERLYVCGEKFGAKFWCSTSPESHVGPFRHAIDFLVPEGTEVLAACDGVVTAIKEDSKLWGPSPEFRNEVNYIDIKCELEDSLHEPGQQYYAEYCHLARGSVGKYGLKVGAEVEQGQTIARTGRSGWMDVDHLHFVVWKPVDDSLFGFRSVQAGLPFPRGWMR